MKKSLVFYSALTLVAAVTLVYVWSRSSTAQAEQPGPPAKMVAAEAKKTAVKATPSVRVYNTGDSKVWPTLRLPLVYKIEVPEVPRGLIGPSPPIPPDAE